MKFSNPKFWEEAILTCVHVLDKTEKPEYLEEDDSYACSKCRDEYEEKGFEETKKNLRVVHRCCLGVKNNGK